MAFTYDKMIDFPVREVDQTLTPDDCILYALGVGLGADPLDERQLRFLYEKDLAVFPTMVNVMGYPGFWLKEQDTGADWRRILHGEQAFTIHRPLPTEGRLIGKSRVRGILDRGPDKGAFLFIERQVTAAETGELICTIEQTSVCRGDGGCGGDDQPPHRLEPIPERDPDAVCDLATLPQAALLYRLNGDRNPLHIDPEVATAAGFERPILHGLCTLGVAGHALLRTLCDYDPGGLVTMGSRFSAPVFPGETVRTEMWRDGRHVSFRSTALERQAVVLNNGYAELAG